MVTCVSEQIREKPDQEAQHRYSLSLELFEKMMARVGPKLKKVGFGDVQYLEKFIGPSLQKGFEPKLEKGGAKIGFFGGGIGN